MAKNQDSEVYKETMSQSEDIIIEKVSISHP